MRLIQEYIREKLIIKETADKASLNSFVENLSKIEEFKDLYDRIQAAWSKRKDDLDFTFEFDISSKEDLVKLYPPCVNEILIKAQEGQNLVHYERLFIVWFLIALEIPVDKIVDIFSVMPDFDREKTTYQVNFAKKKKYVPYQCSTLKTYNLCMAAKYKDELCLEGYGAQDPAERKKLKHPLGYVRIKQYREEKYKKWLENKAKEGVKNSKNE